MVLISKKRALEDPIHWCNVNENWKWGSEDIIDKGSFMHTMILGVVFLEIWFHKDDVAISFELMPNRNAWLNRWKLIGKRLMVIYNHGVSPGVYLLVHVMRWGRQCYTSMLWWNLVMLWCSRKRKIKEDDDYIDGDVDAACDSVDYSTIWWL